MKRPSRRQILVATGIALGLTLILLVLGWVFAGPKLARARLARESAARGLVVEAGRFDLGFGSVRLFDVNVRAPLVPAVSVHLPEVTVDLGWTLRPSTVRVEGGSVQLRGTLDEVKRQVAAYRGRDGRRSRSSGGGLSGTMWEARGIEVTWRESETKRLLHATDVSLRSDTAVTLLTVAEGEFALDRVSARLRTLELELATDAGERRVRRLDAESLLVALDFGSPEAPRPIAPAKSAAVPAALWGEAFWPVDSGRPGSLRGLVEGARGALASALPTGGSLTIDDVTAEIRKDADALHLGPSTFTLRREARAVLVELAPHHDQRAPLQLNLTLPIEAGGVSVRMSGGPVSLSTLGVREKDFGLEHVDRTTLQVTADLGLSADASTLDAVGKVRLVDLAIGNAAIGHELLTGIDFSVSGHSVVATDGRRIEARELGFELGEIRLSGHGMIERGPEGTHLAVGGELPLTACQSLLDVAPKGLLSSVNGTKLSGTFSGKASVDLNTLHPDDLKLEASGTNDCHVAAIPESISPAKFRGVWRRTVKAADDSDVEIESGLGSTEWTPYEAISPNLETAVLISEDGRFFRHHGFDEEAIANSLRENLRAGRFVRGASTISMQLAKNLYLAREKTISRKLEEAILTQLLEQELGKQAMMELYLNVIEFGPGIYGARAAARHYFGTTPAQLSLGQALFLGSILPNPKKNYFDESGLLKAGWAEYLRKLMKIAVKIHRITEADYELGILEEVRLGGAKGDLPGAPSGAPSGPDDAPPYLPDAPGP